MAKELLEDLFAKIEKAHSQRTDRERFAVEPGSSLAGDDKVTRPYQLSHAAVAALGHSIEHLHAIRALIVDAKIMHPGAPFSLARVAIENASIAAWLLAPRRRRDRAMRRLKLALQDAKDGDQAGAEIGSPPNLPAQQHQLGKLAVTITGDPDYALTGYLKTTTIVKAADERLDGTPVLTAWRVCAGFSHGRLWTTLAVLDRDEDISDSSPDIVHAYITNSLTKLHWAVATAWKVYSHARDLYEDRRIKHY